MCAYTPFTYAYIHALEGVLLYGVFKRVYSGMWVLLREFFSGIALAFGFF